MQININTEEGLTEADKAVLRALVGDSTTAPADKVNTGTAKAPTPEKKAAAAKPEPTPDPEPETAPEPDDEPTTGTTLEEAKTLATKMVANGEAAKVKKALGVVGAKKVSEIPEDKVDEFVSALG